MHRHNQQAFSLIEIMVVVSIIAILVALVIVSGSYLQHRQKMSNTRLLLGTCMAIQTEYEGQTGHVLNAFGTSPIDWSDPANKYPVNDIAWFTSPTGANQAVGTIPTESDAFAKDMSTPTYTAASFDLTQFPVPFTSTSSSIKRFVVEARKVSVTSTMLDGLAANFKDLNMTGASPGDGFMWIVDAWGRPLEFRTGGGDHLSATGGINLKARPRPYFVSAGPPTDNPAGDWGDEINAASDPIVTQQTQDNIYSFNVD